MKERYRMVQVDEVLDYLKKLLADIQHTIDNDENLVYCDMDDVDSIKKAIETINELKESSVEKYILSLNSKRIIDKMNLL